MPCPPDNRERRAARGAVPTTWWHALPDGRVQCDLCPRYCRLREGQRGLCFVRACEGGGVVLTTWGRSSGFCVDPTGNVRDADGAATYCRGCGRLVIGRDGYALTAWHLAGDGRCRFCGTRCAGVFEPAPGTWGPRRLPVRLAPDNRLRPLRWQAGQAVSAGAADAAPPETFGGAAVDGARPPAH